MHGAPDGFQATLNLTPGERGIFLSLCHAGAEEEAERILRTLRSIASPTKEVVQRQPFATLAEKAAATNPGNTPPPAFRAIQTVYRDRVTDEIIDIIVDQLAHASPDTIMGLSHYMHGEVCRVKPDATAFPHRQAHSVHLRVAYNWNDPQANEEAIGLGRRMAAPASSSVGRTHLRQLPDLRDQSGLAIGVRPESPPAPGPQEPVRSHELLSKECQHRPSQLPGAVRRPAHFRSGKVNSASPGCLRQIVSLRSARPSRHSATDAPALRRRSVWGRL